MYHRYTKNMSIHAISINIFTPLLMICEYNQTPKFSAFVQQIQEHSSEWKNPRCIQMLATVSRTLKKYQLTNILH